MRKPARWLALVLTALVFSSSMAFAGGTSDGERINEPGENAEKKLAEAAQNPLADMISLPF